jgi:SET and MYND domain-containing protein
MASAALSLEQWTDLQLRLHYNLVRMHSLSCDSCDSGTIAEQSSSSHAIAVFEHVSLLNHSCCPNAMLSFRSRSARVHNIASVEAGSELTISYGACVASHCTADRRTLLRQQYAFLCQCHACLE